MIDNFAVFILTHGRPNNVITYNTLRRQGYTGKIYIIIDNEDKTANDYRKQFGDQVIMFDKKAIAETFDQGDNFDDRRAVIFARNASFEIAKNLGLEYFLQLDDDYQRFNFKFTDKLVYTEKPVKNLDSLFGILLDYYEKIPALTLAISQGGDFIGGKNSGIAEKVTVKRKAMNTFFCSTERLFYFFGRINEDVNTYVTLGNRGKLLMTVFNAEIKQARTQKNKGGMTELYLNTGTYIKSFYTVMYAPSCVKIQQIGYLHYRLHHKVIWNNAVPCIVGEQYRKFNDKIIATA